MNYGICLQSLVPVRAEPSHRSEMVTQLLFGELYTVYGMQDDWISIRLSFDDYEGWICVSQSANLDETEYLRLLHSKTFVSLDLVQLISDPAGPSLTPVLLGSSLPGLDGSVLGISGRTFGFEGAHAPLEQPESSEGQGLTLRKQLLDDAMLYLNAPYHWGGRSPFGIDCSGFVQMAFKLQGIIMPRDASQQAGQGEVVGLLDEATTGDLAFFDDNEGRIIHTGMLLDSHRIIHASGRVKIDPIDHQGIFDAGSGRYSHRLRMIRRII